MLSFARRFLLRFLCGSMVLGVFLEANCPAITLNQLDDFQSSNFEWGIGVLTPVPVVQNAGPGGASDHALYMSTPDMSVSRLLVINLSRWNGNWTTAGITQVSVDVRNPNAFALSMRLGVAGTGGVTPGGFGNTYVSDSISVAADNQWHTLTFDVLPGNFTGIGGTNISAALMDVTQLRFLHNPSLSFIGAVVQGAFYLDNIRALGAPAGVPGDYNSNHVVDASDYVVWRRMLNQTGTGLAADGTGPSGTPDGVVDHLDYDFWRARFGNTSGGGSSAVPSARGVPEPAVGIFVAAGALLCRRTTRCRRQFRRN